MPNCIVEANSGNGSTNLIFPTLKADDETKNLLKAKTRATRRST